MRHGCRERRGQAELKASQSAFREKQDRATPRRALARGKDQEVKAALVRERAEGDEKMGTMAKRMEALLCAA